MGIRNLNKRIFFFLIAFMLVNYTQSQTDFIIHKVRKNQDIEKIAMIYDVDINIILEYNSNTEIKKGVKLKIPRIFNESKRELKIPEIQEIIKSETNLNYDSLIENITDYEKKRIAVMLPFRTKNINFDSIEDSKEIIKNDKLLNISLDFLFGIEMAVDLAKGRGQDYTTFTVFDVTSRPFRQVCTYRNNMIILKGIN